MYDQTSNYLEIEGMRVFSKLLDKTFLESRQGLLLVFHGRIDLHGGEVKVFAESQPEDVQILAAVAEGSQHMSEHLSTFQILWIDEHHAICKRTHTAHIQTGREQFIGSASSPRPPLALVLIMKMKASKCQQDRKRTMTFTVREGSMLS